MADEQPRRPTGPLIGGVLVLLLGVGWFVVSRGVMETALVDAIAESVGVILGLLVVASIVGAVIRSKGSHG